MSRKQLVLAFVVAEAIPLLLFIWKLLEQHR